MQVGRGRSGGVGRYSFSRPALWRWPASCIPTKNKIHESSIPHFKRKKKEHDTSYYLLPGVV